MHLKNYVNMKRELKCNKSHFIYTTKKINQEKDKKGF